MKTKIKFIYLIIFLLVFSFQNSFSLSNEDSDNLFKACEQGNIETVKNLIDLGVNVNAVYEKVGWTPLMISIIKKNFDIVDLLIKSGADIHFTDDKGNSPFILACLSKNISLITTLIKLGVDVNRRSDEWSPLYICALSNNLELLNLLVDAKVNLNAPIYKGGAALLVAAFSGDIKFIKKLIEFGIDVNLIDDAGKSALDVGCSKGNTELVQVLLDAGADVNHPTVLISAVAGGKKEIIQMLLNKKINNINILSKNGFTPLMLASLVGSNEIVKMLANAGADINIENDKGETAISLAEKNKQTKIVKYLKSLKKPVKNQCQGNWIEINDGFTIELIKKDENCIISRNGHLNLTAIFNKEKKIFEISYFQDFYIMKFENDRLILSGDNINTKIFKQISNTLLK